MASRPRRGRSNPVPYIHSWRAARGGAAIPRPPVIASSEQSEERGNPATLFLTTSRGIFYMARRKKTKDNPLDYLILPSLGLNPEIKKTIWALLLLILAVVAGLGLVGSAGAAGVYLNIGLTWLLGWGRYLAPVFLLAWSLFIFLGNRLEIGAVNYVGLTILVLAWHGLLQLFINQHDWPRALTEGLGGGHLGWLVALGLIKAIGLIAAFLLLVALMLIAMMFVFNTTLASLWAKSSWPARLLLHPARFIWHLIAKRQPAEADAEKADKPVENEAAAAEVIEEEIETEETGVDERAPLGAPARPTVAVAAAAAAMNIWHPTNIKISLPLNLLTASSGRPVAADIKNGQKIIEKTLSEFGIEVEMGAISVGPTVTQYTLRPADGIKLSRITNLNNDLAMALAAHPVRIEAPIPGKALVGIEVPNKAIALVGLREVLSSDLFTSRKSDTTIALGKDVAGKVWTADVCKMPHLLVAGATGSGKSVMLNAIIVSLLYQNNPDDLRFIFVDPKRVELTVYNGIPHLLTPVITEVGKTVNALKWCLNEMDRRFKLLEQAGKRDIAGFNQANQQKLPYIVFVIDELADLMLLAGKDVEAGIVRLAQMARAVGIHLILATQRPSVNVITGTIKANMPARIAFAVASSIDSRTILDGMGAEKLLGRGDMLFSDASMAKPKRLQGAFVSEKDIKRVVAEIKRQGGVADYLEEVTDRQKVSGSAGVGLSNAGSEDDDELINDAKDIVINAGKASATLLQRKLSIGYARAAKLLDTLEEHGIIGPAQGAKPREILVSREQYASLEQAAVSGVPLHRRENSQPPQSYLEEDEEEIEDESEEIFGQDSSASQEEEADSIDREAGEERGEEEESDEAESKEDRVTEDGKENEDETAADDDEEDEEEPPKSGPPTSTIKDDYDFDKYFSR